MRPGALQQPPHPEVFEGVLQGDADAGTHAARGDPPLQIEPARLRPHPQGRAHDRRPRRQRKPARRAYLRGGQLPQLPDPRRSTLSGGAEQPDAPLAGKGGGGAVEVSAAGDLLESHPASGAAERVDHSFGVGGGHHEVLFADGKEELAARFLRALQPAAGAHDQRLGEDSWIGGHDVAARAAPHRKPGEKHVALRDAVLPLLGGGEFDDELHHLTVDPHVFRRALGNEKHRLYPARPDVVEKGPDPRIGELGAVVVAAAAPAVEDHDQKRGAGPIHVLGEAAVVEVPLGAAEEVAFEIRVVEHRAVGFEAQPDAPRQIEGVAAVTGRVRRSRRTREAVGDPRRHDNRDQKQYGKSLHFESFMTHRKPMSSPRSLHWRNWMASILA